MEETMFQPKYSIKANLDVLVISLLSLITLLFSYLKYGVSLSNIFWSIFLICFIISFMPHFIRRIIFTSSSFTVERYFWKSKKIEYTDVVDVGISKVKSKVGNISFGGMSNASQLLFLFNQLIEQGKIDKCQFENKLAVEDIILQKTILPSLIVILTLGSALVFLWPSPYSQLSELAVMFAYGFIVFFVISVIYWINKIRFRNH